MKEFLLRGFLETEYTDEGFNTLVLRNEEGLKQDLIYRLREVFSSFKEEPVSVEYIITKSEMSWDDAITGWLMHLEGAIEGFEESKNLFTDPKDRDKDTQIEYKSEDYSYSSMTHGTNYDTYLKINGHDLYKELIFRACEKEYYLNFMIRVGLHKE